MIDCLRSVTSFFEQKHGDMDRVIELESFESNQRYYEQARLFLLSEKWDKMKVRLYYMHIRLVASLALQIPIDDKSPPLQEIRDIFVEMFGWFRLMRGH